MAALNASCVLLDEVDPVFVRASEHHVAHSQTLFVSAQKMLLTKMLLEIWILPEELQMTERQLLPSAASDCTSLYTPPAPCPPSTPRVESIVTSIFRAAIGFLFKGTCAEVARKVLACEMLD